MKHTIRTLEKEIAKIKSEIHKLGDLRPGSLSKQYNVCGTPGCRCKADPPQKHGPYIQLNYTRKGKSHTQFVRRDEEDAVKEQIANYSRLRKLVDLWVELGSELSIMRLKKDRE